MAVSIDINNFIQSFSYLRISHYFENYEGWVASYKISPLTPRLSQIIAIHIISFHYPRIHYILSLCLFAVLHNGLSSQFPTKNRFYFLPICATYTGIYCIFLGIFAEEYMSWLSSLCSFLHSSIISRTHLLGRYAVRIFKNRLSSLSATRRNVQKDGILHSNRGDKIKSYFYYFIRLIS
jgi:hypothetical protein